MTSSTTACGTDLKILVLCGGLTLFAAADSAVADDVWALQGSVCTGTYWWLSDVLFHNAGSETATVRLLEVSNGVPQSSSDRELQLPPGRSSSIARAGKPWLPSAPVPLWVTHLDVPPNVTVESRIILGRTVCIGPQVGGAGIYGKISFPLFRALQPAGVTKIHLGTDLAELPTRNNVAVYNASDVPAHAIAEVRQLCDDTVIDTRQLDIPGKSVVQITGMNATTEGCNPGSGSRYAYVAVTVDQPSLSWVSSLSNADVIKVVWSVTASSP